MPAVNSTLSMVSQVYRGLETHLSAKKKDQKSMKLGDQGSEMLTVTLGRAPDSKPIIVIGKKRHGPPPTRAAIIALMVPALVDMVTASSTTEPTLTTLDSMTSGTSVPIAPSSDDNTAIIIIGSVFGGIIVIGVAVFGCISPLFRRWRDDRIREREMRRFRYITLYAAATDPAVREGPRVTVREINDGVELESLEVGRRDPVDTASPAAAVQGAGAATNHNEDGAQGSTFSGASSQTYVATLPESLEVSAQSDSPVGHDTARPVPDHISTERRTRAGDLAAAQLDGEASGYDDELAIEGEDYRFGQIHAILPGADTMVPRRIAIYLLNGVINIARRLSRRVDELEMEVNRRREDQNELRYEVVELRREVDELIDMNLELGGDVPPHTRSATI